MYDFIVLECRIIGIGIVRACSNVNFFFIRENQIDNTEYITSDTQKFMIKFTPIKRSLLYCCIINIMMIMNSIMNYDAYNHNNI